MPALLQKLSHRDRTRAAVLFGEWSSLLGADPAAAAYVHGDERELSYRRGLLYSRNVSPLMHCMYHLYS